MKKKFGSAWKVAGTLHAVKDGADKLPTWKPLENNNSEDTLTTEVFAGPDHADVNTRDIHSYIEFKLHLTVDSMCME